MPECLKQLDYTWEESNFIPFGTSTRPDDYGKGYSKGLADE
jgi:hypothetical protein